MTVLKPCPFCGSDETSHGFVNAGMIMGNCECHACNACIWANTEAEAIDAWNARIDEPTPSQTVSRDRAVEAARQFHEAYERLAPLYGYDTRADTKAFDPESANGRLMTAVCSEMNAAFKKSEMGHG